MQGMLLGLLLFPIIFKFALQVREYFLSTTSSVSRTYDEIWRSLIFLASLGFVMMVVVPLWMQFVLDFQMHPLLWYYFPTTSSFILSILNFVVGGLSFSVS